MKKVYILLPLLYLVVFPLFGQFVGVGTTTPSNRLDVMGWIQLGDENMAGTAEAGTIRWNAAVGCLQYHDGFIWQCLSANTGDAWLTTGNNGTNPATNFLGTLDNNALAIRANNSEAMRIHPNGNVSIGNTGSAYRLYVYNNDATTRYNIYSNNYSSSNSTQYGIYSYISNSGTGSRYGIYNSTQQSSSSSGTSYGLYNSAGLYGTGNRYGQRNYLYTTGTNNSAIYGNRSYVTSSGSGNHYGEYNEMASSSTYTANIYAEYNDVGGTGNGLHYGQYNLLDASGSGAHYATYNEVTSSGAGSQYGLYTVLDNSGTGTHYGATNFLTGTGISGTRYGTYNFTGGSSNSTKYGTYNYVADGTGSQYGSYNFVSSSGTGTHYGVYASAYGDFNKAVYGSNTHPTGWAAYFLGNGYVSGDLGVGTNTPERKLHVRDNTNSTQASMLVENTNTGIDADATLNMRTNYLGNTTNFAIGINNSMWQDLQFCEDNWVGNNIRMIIEQGTGRVGVNTIFPAATLDVDGTVDATIKSFKIDHPDDPANKTLRHFSMESDKGLVMYSGKVQLDANGEGTIQMPDYYVSLTDEANGLVHLTPIGRNPFMASYEWSQDFTTFTVYGQPNREVSWQVTAERDDPTYAYRKQPVEATKGQNSPIPAGRYIDPEAHGVSPELGLDRQSGEVYKPAPVEPGVEETPVDLVTPEGSVPTREFRSKRDAQRAKDRKEAEELGQQELNRSVETPEED